MGSDASRRSSGPPAFAEELFQSVGDMVCMLDLEGRVAWVNAAGEAMTGYPAGELVGRSSLSFIAPEHRERAIQQFRERLETDANRPGDDSVLLRSDGTRIPIEITSILISGPDGPTAVLGLVRDVSRHREVEEALRRSEDQFRGAFASAAIGMAIVATDGRFVQVNEALCSMMGYDEPDFIELGFQQITHPDDLAADLEQLERCLAGEIDSYAMEKRYFHRDGHLVWGLLTVSLLRDGEGEPIHFVSQVQDITERKRAEEALRQSRAMLAEAQNLARLGSWQWDAETNVVTWSDAMYRIFGVDPETVPTLDPEIFFGYVHPDDRRGAQAEVKRMSEEGGSSEVEYRIVRDDGEIRWIHGRREAIVVDGAIVGIRGTGQDITERKEAEARVAEAEARYRTLVEQLPLCTYIRPVDMTKPNSYCSPQVEAILGHAPEAWLTDPDILAASVHPDDRERVLEDAARLRATGEPIHAEYRYVRPDGTTVWVQDETYLVAGPDGEPSVQGFLLDITERKLAEQERDALEEELHHAQKMDAIGQLAGGIAHDFNNTLTAIRGYAELLGAALPDDEQLRRYAEEIRKTAEAGAALPRQLLAFGRKQPLTLTTLALNEVVADSCDLFRPLLGEGIDLAWIPGPALSVVSDSAQLGQALLNLALNARDAMPDGGRLTVELRWERLDAETAGAHGAAGGDYAVIVVRDTGAGMDEETRLRAFEPFFTTKESGTGLGLATVYGIMRQSGGFASIDSAPGRGTTVELYLPSEAPVPATKPAARPAASTVLVVEDEEAVRGLLREVLELAGFTVLSAASAAEALRVFERADGAVEAVVTDLKMPGMDGVELVRRIREVAPGLPVVAVSAYTERPPDAGEDFVLLSKPFSAAELVSAVDEAVGVTPPPLAAVPDPGPAISVLVADDHPPVLDSVARVLERQGFRVVGTAIDGETALRRIVDRRPQVALVDIRMNGMSGVEVARRAAELAPRTAVVLYTGQGDRELLRQALDAGARGFLLKDAPLEEVAATLRQVALGDTHVDPELAETMASPEAVAKLPSLTDREREVLALLAEGMTNDGAASQLSISSETVQTHVRKAMAKLQADTRTAAVATALRLALIA